MSDSGPLVGAPDLAVELGLRPGGGATGPAPVVLDVRWRLLGPPPAELYAAGHLPGAVAVDLDADLAAPPGPGGRHPLPDPADLQRRCAASASGQMAPWSRTTTATAAARPGPGGCCAGPAPGRAGARRRLRRLDRRRPAPQTEVPVPVPGDVVVRPGGMPVLDAGRRGDVAARGVLLDARAAERFRGEVEPVDPVAGHVPGARSAPLTGDVGPDGRFLPAGGAASPVRRARGHRGRAGGRRTAGPG